MNRIKTSNSILHDLANQTCGMEPSRQRRSQARLIKLIRGLTKSLFHAIWNATTCDCNRPHEVCLELVPRNATIVPGDSEDEVAKSFGFYVAFGSYGTTPTDIKGRTSENQEPGRWNTFDFRIAMLDAAVSCPPVPHAQIASATPKPSKRVGWSGSLSSTSQTTKSTRTLVGASKTLCALPKITAHAQKPVSNLCRDILKRQKMAATDCHGYITDTNRKFAMHPRQEPADIVATLTLRELLRDHEKRSLNFDYMQRLKVALAIATCVLHLYKTPWLARVVTLDDFVFLRADVSLMSGLQSPDSPFIAKNVSSVSNTQANDQRRPINLTILSLGALLIQVIIGKKMKELDMAGNTEMDMNTILTRHEAGSRLRDQVLENGGLNYTHAVKWCLDNVFNVASLENEGFCQAFYNEIVARLQEDISYLS